MDEQEQFERYWDARSNPLATEHVEHQDVAMREFQDHMAVLHKGLFALAIGLESQKPQTWGSTFANEFGSVACFARALSGLRAATALVVSGYYNEVEVLLRSAYESASLGRLLAKEPAIADRWLTKNTWVPDGHVRRWVEEQRGEGEAASFDAYYRQASNMTHPTAQAAVRSIEFDDDQWSPRTAPSYDPEAVRVLLGMCAGIVGFACAALRNAASVDEALPPGLGSLIAEVLADVETLTGLATSRDERDWDAIEQRRSDVLERVRPVEQLDEELESNPASWRNLGRSGGG